MLPVEGISQVWNGVATDNDTLSYIADTLLISFQDKKCLMELKTKYSIQPNKNAGSPSHGTSCTHY